MVSDAASFGGTGGGADTRIRTGDLPLTRRLLYQLSYAGTGMTRAGSGRGWRF